MKILFLFQQNDICAIFYSDFFQTLISYCQQQPCTSSRLNLFSLFLILYSPVLFLEEKYPSEFLHLYLDIVLSDAPSYRRPPAFTQLLLPLCSHQAVLPFPSGPSCCSNESHTPPAFLLKLFCWVLAQYRFLKPAAIPFCGTQQATLQFPLAVAGNIICPCSPVSKSTLKAAAEGCHPFFPLCSSQRSLIF